MVQYPRLRVTRTYRFQGDDIQRGITRKRCKRAIYSYKDRLVSRIYRSTLFKMTLNDPRFHGNGVSINAFGILFPICFNDTIFLKHACVAQRTKPLNQNTCLFDSLQFTEHMPPNAYLLMTSWRNGPSVSYAPVGYAQHSLYVAEAKRFHYVPLARCPGFWPVVSCQHGPARRPGESTPWSTYGFNRLASESDTLMHLWRHQITVSV